jgi:hypothetical protein
MGDGGVCFCEARDFCIGEYDRMRKNRSGTKESFVIE